MSPFTLGSIPNNYTPHTWIWKLRAARAPIPEELREFNRRYQRERYRRLHPKAPTRERLPVVVAHPLPVTGMSLTELVARVLAWTGVRHNAFFGRCRFTEVVRARTVCAVAARMLSAGYSFPEIGKAMGRPHTTVIEAHYRGLKEPETVRLATLLAGQINGKAETFRRGGTLHPGELEMVAAEYRRQHPPRADYRRIA